MTAAIIIRGHSHNNAKTRGEAAPESDGMAIRVDAQAMEVWWHGRTGI